MGDKPSVEAKSFQSDIDDHNLYHFASVNQQDVMQNTAGTTDTSFTNRALSNVGDTGDVAASTQADFVVNGVWLNCYASPSLTDKLASSPKRRMKQSKSANHNINGDTGVKPLRDGGKRSLSMGGTLTSTESHPTDSSVTVVDNCVPSPSSHSEAAANTSAPVEPPSPSSSSTVTVVSLVHADSEGRQQQSGY